MAVTVKEMERGVNVSGRLLFFFTSNTSPEMLLKSLIELAESTATAN